MSFPSIKFCIDPQRSSCHFCQMSPRTKIQTEKPHKPPSAHHIPPKVISKPAGAVVQAGLRPLVLVSWVLHLGSWTPPPWRGALQYKGAGAPPPTHPHLPPRSPRDHPSIPLPIPPLPHGFRRPGAEIRIQRVETKRNTFFFV